MYNTKLVAMLYHTSNKFTSASEVSFVCLAKWQATCVFMYTGAQTTNDVHYLFYIILSS